MYMYYSLQMKAMLFVTNLTWNSFTSQNSETVKLYLGNGFVLILQSGSIFQFSLINISATECSLHSKNCFFLTPGYFLRAPNNLNSWSLGHFLIFLEGLSYWELTLYVKVNSKVSQKSWVKKVCCSHSEFCT